MEVCDLRLAVHSSRLRSRSPQEGGGEHWNDIVRAARESNLPSVAKYVHDLAPAWDGYLRKECLRLRAKLGVEVEPRVPLSERRDPDARSKRVAQEIFAEGCLRGQVRVPDAASDLSIEVNIAAGLVRFGAELQAPQEGRQQTRINWLLKQLKDESVPADMVVKVDWDRKGLRTLGKAGELRVNASGLMFDGYHQPVPADAMPRRFLLEHTCKLDKPKGQVDHQRAQGDLGRPRGVLRQRRRALAGYVAPAPKLPKEPAASAVEPVSDALPAAVPIAARMELERESSPAELDAGVQHASREVAADTVLAARAPDESTP